MNQEKEESIKISTTPTLNSTMGNTTLTLRTSNRYKKLISERRKITDIFNNHTAKTLEINLKNEESRIEPDSPILSITKSNMTESCLSPVSLYSNENEDKIDTEPLNYPNELLQVHSILDTGDTKKLSSQSIKSVKRSTRTTRTSTISKLFYKIISNKSNDDNENDDIKLNNNIRSPYLKNELKDQLNNILNRIEIIDSKNPNHYTGCLIIHCKMLKMIFEMNEKPYIIKHKINNKFPTSSSISSMSLSSISSPISSTSSISSISSSSTLLEKWRVIIQSMDIFINGLEQGKININKEGEKKEEEKEQDEKEQQEDKINEKTENIEIIPNKYKLSIKKDLYSYQDNSNILESNEFEKFLQELNNKLNLTNDNNIL